MKRIKIKKLSTNNFEKIIIPQRFSENQPKPEKVIQKMLKFQRESELDNIIVDGNYVLLDGYCSYLIAKEVGPEFVKIMQVKGY